MRLIKFNRDHLQCVCVWYQVIPSDTKCVLFNKATEASELPIGLARDAQHQCLTNRSLWLCKQASNQIDAHPYYHNNNHSHYRTYYASNQIITSVHYWSSFCEHQCEIFPRDIISLTSDIFRDCFTHCLKCFRHSSYWRLCSWLGVILVANIAVASHHQMRREKKEKEEILAITMTPYDLI